jgi:hypothetical protein
MTCIHGDTIRTSFALAVNRDMLDGDLAISYIHHAGQLSWFDKKEMTSQMKSWRKLAKEGKMKMGHYNNKTKKTDDGREWFFLVAQCYDPITTKMKECNFDPLGLFVMGEMVSGYLYAFRNKENRDKVFEYVMKDIAPPNPDEIGEDDEED